jgi:hypothetical protein
MCKFFQILYFILKNYHKFESYQNMLIILYFYFLYHKLQIYYISHVHYTLFRCDIKILRLFWIFEFENCQITGLVDNWTPHHFRKLPKKTQIGKLEKLIYWSTLTRSQVTGWNPLEGFTKSSCGKLKLGGTLPAPNSRKG